MTDNRGSAPDKRDTRTFAVLMLGKLLPERKALGHGMVQDEFKGKCMEALMNQETARNDLLNQVDTLMRLCLCKGFETGCQMGDFPLTSYRTSTADEGEGAL